MYLARFIYLNKWQRAASATNYVIKYRRCKKRAEKNVKNVIKIKKRFKTLDKKRSSPIHNA